MWSRSGSPSGAASTIGFWGFTRIGAPFALVSLIVASLYLWLRYFAGA